MSGKVIVVTRTKNRPLLLQRCVESVLNQTYANWLHVIVNDGGDPAAVEGITGRFGARYQDRLKIIHNPESVGMQNASNIAIKSAEGDFVTIHDDDDTWLPLFLEECVRHLENTKDPLEQGVVTQSTWITEEIDSWGKVIELSRQHYMPFEHVGLFQIAAKNLFPPIAFVYRRQVHDAIGYFDQTFNELGDHDFNLRFVSKFNVGVLPEQLAGYHWRHQAHGTPYGNTVTDGVASHHRTLVKMQNHYLRQDLANHQMGLGFLMGTAQSFEAQLGWMHGFHTQSQHARERITRKFLYYDRLLAALFTPWKNKPWPIRFYDHLLDVVAKSPAKKNGEPPSALNGLSADLKKAAVLSLDVFDTTLARLVRKPTDVFLYIQSEVRQLLGQPNLQFVAVRIAAENEAREKMRRIHASGETTLDEIYAVLQRRLDCDATTIKKIRQLELEAERKLCFAHPAIKELVAQAANGQKKVIFASDMYLPAGEITGLLERNGFNRPQLFLSSELRINKHDGAMFDHVLEKLQSEPARMLHVGDNLKSDVERPRSKGISAVHWAAPKSQVPLVDQQNSMSGAWEGDLASSLYTGLVRRRRMEHPVGHAGEKAFWKMIGYEVIGPLYHAFVSWVISRAKKRGLKKIFFLARDGYNLTKVFDAFKQKNRLDMTGQYLFASRRLLNLPRIERLDEEAMSFLIAPNPAMRPCDFLSRIGIDPAPHEALLQRNGFKHREKHITTKDGIFINIDADQSMRRVMRELETDILVKAREERVKLLAYLKQSGLNEPGAAIVDIGWHGSSLRSLNQLLTLMPNPQKIPGFYFGTWKYARAVVNAGCDFESFFMHLSLPQHRTHLVAESVEMIESFFTAPHPSIIGIEQKNGGWEPVYGQPEVDPKMQAELAVATDAAHEFVRDALAIWPDQEMALPFGYLETTLERLLRHPHKDEAEVLGKFSLRNTFGGSGPLRHVAVLPNTWKRISKKHGLQYAYDHCYWKRGFYVQLGKRARKYIVP